jgi:hypothetical protein
VSETELYRRRIRRQTYSSPGGWPRRCLTNVLKSPWHELSDFEPYEPCNPKHPISKGWICMHRYRGPNGAFLWNLRNGLGRLQGVERRGLGGELCHGPLQVAIVFFQLLPLLSAECLNFVFAEFSLAPFPLISTYVLSQLGERETVGIVEAGCEQHMYLHGARSFRPIDKLREFSVLTTLVFSPPLLPGCV